MGEKARAALRALHVGIIGTMASLRLLGSAARRALRVPLGRRGYAEASDKIQLTLVLPHQVKRFLCLGYGHSFLIDPLQLNRCRPSEHRRCHW